MEIKDWFSFVCGYIERHPEAGAADIYKLLHQAFLGPGHLLDDLDAARERFIAEFESTEPAAGEIFEPIDPDGSVVRIGFGPFKASGGSREELWRTILLTSKLWFPDIHGFRGVWREITGVFGRSEPIDEDWLGLTAAIAEDYPPPVRHSDLFVEAEEPHYRVVSSMAINGIGGAIQNLLNEAIGKAARIETSPMPDIHKGAPKHAVDIDKVGVRGLSYPIVVLDRSDKRQRTVAEVAISVDLPSRWRGAHMSRFIEILNRYRGEITSTQIESILEEMRAVFDARAANIELEFPYFLEKQAPVSGSPSMMCYIARFDGRLDPRGYRFRLGVKVPTTTLCPCSKEICDRGAHSQRASVEISVVSRDFVWLEELIELAEDAASSPVYTLLKREDEKFVSEHAYDNPRFVEDVAREIASELDGRGDMFEFDVTVTSTESIHNHDAFAHISGGKWR